MTKEYITKEGLQKLQEELELLRTTRREEIAENIAEAKELGDLSENAEYAAAKDEQAFNEGRIIEIEEKLKNAEIISDRRHAGIIGVGSTIKVVNSGAEREYTIVGSTEADPMNNRISNESPLGQAFLGKKVGDEIIIQIPKGAVKIKIMEVR